MRSHSPYHIRDGFATAGKVALMLSDLGFEVKVDENIMYMAGASMLRNLKSMPVEHKEGLNWLASYSKGTPSCEMEGRY